MLAQKRSVIFVDVYCSDIIGKLYLKGVATSTVQLRHRLSYEQTFQDNTTCYIVATDTVQIRFRIKVH